MSARIRNRPAALIGYRGPALKIDDLSAMTEQSDHAAESASVREHKALPCLHHDAPVANPLSVRQCSSIVLPCPHPGPPPRHARPLVGHRRRRGRAAKGETAAGGRAVITGQECEHRCRIRLPFVPPACTRPRGRAAGPLRCSRPRAIPGRWSGSCPPMPPRCRCRPACRRGSPRAFICCSRRARPTCCGRPRNRCARPLSAW